MSHLAEGYRRCATLTRQFGTTYYWGARILSPAQRRDVYAVYALCRLADDILDEPDRPIAGIPAGTPEARLFAFRRAFAESVAAGGSPDPVLAAVADSLTRRGTDLECFDRFFDAMALDLVRTRWESWEQLRDEYMEGSAAVIGEMMLPVLEPYTPGAKHPARTLGHAFQLTNFLRDVGEDLDRGRVYLPADELADAGADPWLRRVTPQWRDFMTMQIERNRALYRVAETGLPMLPPGSRRCVATALVLYRRILERIEQADFDVFSQRRRVPTSEKVAVAGQALLGLDVTRSRRVDGPRPSPVPLEASR